MIRPFDVVVVGAGPAGSGAALAAARAGADTLIIDRADFPRYKTCGGGLNGLTLAALPADLELPVQREVRGASFSLACRAARRWQASRRALTLVNRDEFDHALLQRVVREGVTARLRTSVSSLQEDAEGVLLNTSNGPVRGRFAIGADGSASRLARHVGVATGQVDLGLELELDGTGLMDAWADRVLVDWGPIQGSYGWVFPKRSTLTVGVIARRGRPAETRSYLATLVDRLGLSGAAVERDSGHLTRCRRPESPLGRGRVLVCGDAAGLLEPFTREGISFAVRSGLVAGQIAAGAALRGLRPATAVAEYSTEIDATLGAEMAAGARLLAVYQRHPALLHHALAGTPFGWHTFLRITRGQSTVASVLRHRAARWGMALLGG